MAFTYFFRDGQTLNLIAEIAIPDLSKRRYINVWDAGCAMGPEPYSVAITIREHIGHFLYRNVRIYATDIDECNQFGAIINRGVYPESELRRLPEGLLSRYFSPVSSGYYEIEEEIRKSVVFQQHDLLSLQPIREGFGLIVCKNVLLHFSAQERVQVVGMFHGALAEGGYLVTEQTQKLPPETEPLFRRMTNAGQVFQKV